MKVAIFSSTPYERQYLDEANRAEHHKLRYIDVSLDIDTVGLAAGYGAVCIFVNDKANADVLEPLHKGGTRLLALRCTGFNNVDYLDHLGFRVVGPAYALGRIGAYRDERERKEQPNRQPQAVQDRQHSKRRAG